MEKKKEKSELEKISEQFLSKKRGYDYRRLIKANACEMALEHFSRCLKKPSDDLQILSDLPQTNKKQQ